jgi:hypothetical protein
MSVDAVSSPPTDQLCRALMDVAKLVEVFDRKVTFGA